MRLSRDLDAAVAVIGLEPKAVAHIAEVLQTTYQRARASFKRLEAAGLAERRMVLTNDGRRTRHVEGWILTRKGLLMARVWRAP